MSTTKTASRNGTSADSEVQIERITPKQAEALLAANSRNRNLRMPIVAQMAGAMQRGEWMFNGESIKIARNGALLDGQHRLTAIVAAKTPQRMLVVRGLPDVAQETIDTGAARTAGDVLHLRGEARYALLAGALRCVWNYRTHRTFQSRFLRPTTQELVSLLDEHSHIRDSLPYSERLRHYVRVPPGPFAAMHYLFAQAANADASVFFERLTQGEGLQHDDPVYLLRTALLRDSQYTRKAPPHVKVAWAIKAWNAWRVGEQARERLTWQPTRGEPFPLVDGLSESFFKGSPVTGVDAAQATIERLEAVEA